MPNFVLLYIMYIYILLSGGFLNMKKKVLSIILALVMVAGMVPFGAITAFAESSTTSSSGQLGTVITGDFSISDRVFTGEDSNSPFAIRTNSQATVTFDNVTFKDIDFTCVRIEHSDDRAEETDPEEKLTVNFNNCRFINCGHLDDSNGGAVQVTEDGRTEVNFSNCIAFDCKAYNGGFLYCDNEKAQINGYGSTVCSNCYATNYGGAVYMYDGTGIDGFTFTENYAQKEGGAIYNQCNNDSLGQMKNCSFYNNHAEIGGAIWSRNDKDFEPEYGYILRNCRFYNSGDQSGHDIYLDKFIGVEYLTFYSEYPNNTVESHLSGETTLDEYYYYSGGYKQHYLYSYDANRVSFASISDLTLPEDSFGVYNINSRFDWDCFYFDLLNGRHNGFENKLVRLNADIIAWQPAGSYNSGGDTEKAFKGTFDGLGHTVTIAGVDGNSHKGVFSCTDGATVKNLNVNGYITGDWSLGGVVGHSDASTIYNCKNYAWIENLAGITEGGYIGGIVGFATTGTRIDNCENHTNITALTYAGGIAGFMENGALANNCRNFGEDIKATSAYAGGIAGAINSGSCIMNSSNQSFIYATVCAGGLAGSVGENSSIYNSIAAPSHVTVSFAFAGGLAGDNKGDIFNCLYGGSVTTGNTPSQDFTGNNSGRVERCYTYGQLNLDEGYFNRTISENLCGVESTAEWFYWRKDNDVYELNRPLYTYQDYDAAANALVDRALPFSVVFTEYNGGSMGQQDAETWYVAKKDITEANRIEIKGHVHLILMNGIKLDFQKGICLSAGNTLSVHSEYAGAPGGTLEAYYQETDEPHNAAIGGDAECDCGTLNVFGGNITAYTQWFAAAIGGGFMGAGGTVNVYGGTVTASVGGNGQGIGAGFSSLPGKTGQLNVFGGIISINDGGGSSGSTPLNVRSRAECFYDPICYFDDMESSIDEYNGQHRIYIDARWIQVLNKHVLKDSFEEATSTDPITGEVIPGCHTYYECTCGHYFSTYNEQTGELSGEIEDLEYWKTHEGKKTDNEYHTLTFTDALHAVRYVDDGKCLPTEYIPKPDKIHKDKLQLGWTYTKAGETYFFNETVPVTEDLTLTYVEMTKQEILDFADKTEITASDKTTLTSLYGIYTVSADSDIVIDNRCEVSDWAVIILPDGCNITFSNGIGVSEYRKLFIMTADGVIGTGRLTAIGRGKASGIGDNGGKVNIYGGTVRAEGDTAFGCSVTLGEYLKAYDITNGEENAPVADEYTGVKKILVKFSPFDSGKAPTCTESGNLEYYKYDNKYYEDPTCTKEITDLSAWLSTLAADGGGMIPATGHNFSYTVSRGTKNIYIVYARCKKCGYTYYSCFDPYNYIAAEKGAYIDTGYKPTENTRVVMDVYVNGGREYWFGVWDTNYNQSAFALGNDGEGIYAGYGNQGGTNSMGPLSNGFHTVEMNKNEVYFDGVHYTGIAHSYSSEGFPIQNTLYLFAQNRKGKAIVLDDQSTICCYGCEIYEGDTLVHKFVPVKAGYSGDYEGLYDGIYAGFNGASGLLDVVGGLFYENSGTASMTVKNDDTACTHAKTSVTYAWGTDSRSCTASLVCDTCHTVLESETLSWMDLSIRTVPAEKCTERSYVYYIAEFENELFGSVESEKIYTGYGPHHYVDYICEDCPAEDLEGAKNDAKRAIRNPVDNSEDTIVLLLAETAETIIDNAEEVAEVMAIRNRCVAAIEKLTGEVHEHTFADEWSFDETKHWHAATCGHEDAVTGFGGHTFGENNKCTVCGYEDTGIRAKVCTVILTSLTEPDTVLYSGTTDGTNICNIGNVANGTYLMSVSCEGAVTRTYTTEITDGKLTQEVALYAEGDVNGDGEITVEDYSAAVNAALASDSAVPEDLTETADYQKAVADLDKDGVVDVLDVVLLERKIY